MGSDASQQEDSGQHTAPLPTPPMLSGDTPIAPTPEQVRKPGVRTVRSRQVGHTRQGGALSEFTVHGASASSSQQPTGYV